MSLHEEAERYRKLSGDYNPKTPISRIGGYLDGYERAMQELTADPDTVSRQQAIDAMGKATWAINRINELPPSPGRLFEHSKQNDDFEKQIHAMFDHIWDCEIEHPVFQDTVGDLMTAFIKCHADMRGGAV